MKKINSLILCLFLLSGCAVGSGLLSGAGAVRSYSVEKSTENRLNDLERSLEYILEIMEKNNDL